MISCRTCMVHDGMRIAGDGFTFECVATPGHTANHVCYALTEEKALFSGDHVMGWSTSVIAPPDGDMGQYIASLEKLMARDETLFYPTHGSPIPDAKAWVAQLIAHRREREQQILAALHGGESSVTAAGAAALSGYRAGLTGGRGAAGDGASAASGGKRRRGAGRRAVAALSV